MRSRYFPLVNCTSDGLEKVPMFSGDDFFGVIENTGYALIRMSANRYRVFAQEPHEPEEYKKIKIHCPVCGEIMDIISPHITKNTLALYACKNCNETR